MIVSEDRQLEAIADEELQVTQVEGTNNNIHGSFGEDQKDEKEELDTQAQQPEFKSPYAVGVQTRTGKTKEKKDSSNKKGRRGRKKP